MPQVERTHRGISKRVVYVDIDDEIDGADDDFEEFGAWLPEEGVIPGLCSTNCQEVSESTYAQSEKISHAICVQRGGGLITQAPICNADALNEIAQKWPKSEPYALAKPSESGKIGNRARRRYKERHNYAKALLRSDKELVKYSRKIRLEIQQGEMLEVAYEAERAANAGIQRFSARPSTFGLDVLHNGRNTLNLRRTKTFSEEDTNRTSISHDKRMKMQLRNVSEVIPQWKELHSNMKTHLFRRKVEEGTLFFHEEETESLQSERSGPNESETSDMTTRPFNFFGDLADRTLTKLKTRGVIQKTSLCDLKPLERVAEEESQVSATSNNGKFGPTLASHLSPYSTGQAFGRPSLSLLPGLVHPDETHELIHSPKAAREDDAFNLTYFPANLCGPTTEERESCVCDKHKFSVGGETHRLCSPGFLGREISTPEVEVRSVRESDRAVDPDTATGYLAVFDAEDQDDLKSENASPKRRKKRQVSQDSCYATPITETPRRPIATPLVATSNDEIGFATPAGLRDIRWQTMQRSADTVLMTPELLSFRLEPSSIIETNCGSENESESTSTPLPPFPKEDDLFLALPQDPPSATHLGGRPARRSQTGHAFYSERFAKSAASKLQGATNVPITEGNLRKPNNAASLVTSSGSRHENQNPFVFSRKKMQSSVLAQTPILSENIPQLEASNDDDHEVVMLGKSVERLRGKGIVPCEYDGASITPFDQSEEKKESEHTLFRGSDVQFLANEESKPFYSVFTSSASEVNEDKSPGGNRPVDALENKMQSAMSFDRESNDDDSSVSLSIGNENPCLWPARSWGGGLREDRKLIRKTLSWPGGAFDPRSNTRGCSGLHFDEKHLTSPATPTPKGLDRGLQNSISCSDSHGICHTFPSTDESLQVVVDEMMSRLSPITGARRKDTYISEDKNNEFLDNYLYCTKIDGDPKASGYKRPEEHICLDPCQGNEFLCHTLGVDTVCNGIQFIFDKQRVRPETAEATPRQRSLSLDNSLPKDSSINWLRSVQNLFRQVGSGLVPASEERQEAVQFEPPCLKKAALELE